MGKSELEKLPTEVLDNVEQAVQAVLVEVGKQRLKRNKKSEARLRVALRQVTRKAYEQYRDQVQAITQAEK